jgi:hypothetical protein
MSTTKHIVGTADAAVIKKEDIREAEGTKSQADKEVEDRDDNGKEDIQEADKEYNPEGTNSLADKEVEDSDSDSDGNGMSWCGPDCCGDTRRSSYSGSDPESDDDDNEVDNDGSGPDCYGNTTNAVESKLDNDAGNNCSDPNGYEDPTKDVESHSKSDDDYETDNSCDSTCCGYSALTYIQSGVTITMKAKVVRNGTGVDAEASARGSRVDISKSYLHPDGSHTQDNMYSLDVRNEITHLIDKLGKFLHLGASVEDLKNFKNCLDLNSKRMRFFIGVMDKYEHEKAKEELSTVINNEKAKEEYKDEWSTATNNE